MKKNSRLYNALNTWLGQSDEWVHLAHLTTGVWIAVALIHTGSVNLTRWLSYIPRRGLHAQSKQRPVHRWLHNPRINVHRLYKPLIKAALAHWQEPCIYLSLDTSLFWNKYCLVRLAVVHHGDRFARSLASDETPECFCVVHRLSRDAPTGSEAIAFWGEGGLARRPRLCPDRPDEGINPPMGMALPNSTQE